MFSPSIILTVLFSFISLSILSSTVNGGDHRELAGVQPLSQIRIHAATLALDGSASVKASPSLLGMQGEDNEWIKVELRYPNPSADDWIGVFSPAKFNSSTCFADPGNTREQAPLICSSPIKYQFANYSNSKYVQTGNGTLRFQLINQRSDFSFALLSGGLANPKLVAVSNPVAFANPKAPVYPRLAQGKAWNEMAVTWTSGYDIDEAIPFVEWGPEKGPKTPSPAATLTFNRHDMCGTVFGFISISSIMQFTGKKLVSFLSGYHENRKEIYAKHDIEVNM